MGRKFDYDKAAQALVDAAYLSDGDAAKRHGVTQRTIRNWRQRLEEDELLSDIFRQKKELVDEGWASELPSAIRSAIRYIRESSKEVTLGDPDGLHAVAGALKILSEVAITRELLDARLANQHRENSS